MKAPTRALVVALLCAGFFACGDSVREPSVAAPDALGPFAVGHVSFTAVDPRRGDRSIPVDVWYPAAAADVGSASRAFYPLAGPIGLDSDVALEGVPVSPGPRRSLVVFSHGYGGIALQSIDLMEALASHGFVTASLEHTGNSQATPTDSFDDAAANRVPDVSFVVDTMIARSRAPGDLFSGHIDEDRVGVIGHSFGGMTAIGMAAGWAGAEPDPRVAAIAPISAVIDAAMQSTPREGSNAGFSPQQLARVAVPVLLVGGTEDADVSIGNNALAFEQLTASPRVYEVDIRGANHTHFASVCTFGDLLLGLGIGKESWPAVGAAELVAPYDATCTPAAFPIAEASRLVSLYAVSFFRWHLVGDRGYARFLTPGFARTEPAIALSVR